VIETPRHLFAAMIANRANHLEGLTVQNIKLFVPTIANVGPLTGRAFYVFRFSLLFSAVSLLPQFAFPVIGE